MTNNPSARPANATLIAAVPMGAEADGAVPAFQAALGELVASLGSRSGRRRIQARRVRCWE